MRLLFCTAIFYLISSTQTANILFYFGVSSYSHRISVWPLVISLAERGHNITFVTIYPPKPEHVHPNITEFFPVENAHKLFIMGSVLNIRVNEGRFGTIKIASTLPVMGLEICNQLLSSKAASDWLQNSKYDLVIIDALFNECGFGLAHAFRSKIIIFGTSTVFSWWHDAIGFPAETSWISDQIVSFPYPMRFMERVLSTLLPLMQYYVKTWSYYPQLDVLLREKLNSSNMPSVEDLEKQTSLILLSSHFSEEFSRSLPPLIVPVGGIHLDGRPSKGKIPLAMKKWMDDSGPNGFIYVSFGSVANIAEASPELQTIFYTSFTNSKTRFLWKWEGDRPAEMPSNVLTEKWMPQREILAHPNIKAFITHGGLMSLTEAITHGVPLIMFPVFAEQDYNSYRYEREGRGIRLEISTLTTNQLQNALSEILTNPMYKKKMLETMKLFKDRQTSPLETAVWWTEYVLRHDNLTCLLPLSIHQTWYERRLLDVWGFVFGLLFVSLGMVFWIFKKILCWGCGNGKQDRKSSTIVVEKLKSS